MLCRLCSLTVAALLLTPVLADGGTLGKVVNGLKQRSGQTDDKKADNSSTSSDDSSQSKPSRDFSDYTGGGGYNTSRAYTPRPILMGPYPTSTAGADVELYLGMASVADSDGAMRASLRASSGRFGIGIDNTRYFEQTPTIMGPQYLHLDVWSLTGAYRAVEMGDRGNTAVWLSAGIAGQASDGLHVLGATIGAEVAHNLNSAVGLEGSARVFAMQDDIRAIELRVGVAASILRLSYRVLKFNVGPALRGPEVGVALRF